MSISGGGDVNWWSKKMPRKCNLNSTLPEVCAFWDAGPRSNSPNERLLLVGSEANGISLSMNIALICDSFV